MTISATALAQRARKLFREHENRWTKLNKANHEKSIINPRQQSMKSQWKSRPGGGLGGLWLPSPSCEAFGVAPERFVKPTWRQVGFQNQAQIEKISMQKSIKRLMLACQDRFLIGFGWILAGTWRQVSINILSEIDVNFERPIFTKTHNNQLFFDDFCVFGEASWDRKSIKNWYKYQIIRR